VACKKSETKPLVNFPEVKLQMHAPVFGSPRFIPLQLSTNSVMYRGEGLGVQTHAPPPEISKF
jgi:hypothetical protein